MFNNTSSDYSIPKTLLLGEGALGGLIPTAFMIILVAVIRIIKLYQRRTTNTPTG